MIRAVPPTAAGAGCISSWLPAHPRSTEILVVGAPMSAGEANGEEKRCWVEAACKRARKQASRQRKGGRPSQEEATNAHPVHLLSIESQDAWDAVRAKAGRQMDNQMQRSHCRPFGNPNRKLATRLPRPVETPPPPLSHRADGRLTRHPQGASMLIRCRDTSGCRGRHCIPTAWNPGGGSRSSTWGGA